MTTLLTWSNISILTTILPVLAALVNYKHLDTTLKIAALFFGISALFDLTLVWVVHRGMTNNVPLIHLFIMLSILFFSVIYRRILEGPLLKKIIVYLALAALMIALLNAFFINGIWNYPSLSNTAQSILLIVFSLLYFYQLFNKQEFVYIEKQALFWINAGVLVYFSVNIFLFMLFNRILHQQMEGFYVIHSITNIFANLLYTVGLLCRPQKTA